MSRAFHYVVSMSLENEDYEDYYIKHIIDCNQLKITSQAFSDYAECIEAFNHFNKDLLNDLQATSNKEHKIAWESNPLFIKKSNQQFIPGKWEQNEILKVYFFNETEYNKLLNSSNSLQENITPLVKGSIFVENTEHLATNKFLH